MENFFKNNRQIVDSDGRRLEGDNNLQSFINREKYCGEDPEQEKTDEDFKAIKKFNEYIKAEVEKFGIKYQSIEPDKIKIFSKEDFEDIENIQEEGAVGTFSSTDGIIYLSKRGLSTYHNLMHEMIHRASFQLFKKEDKYNENDEHEKSFYDIARLGYRFSNESFYENRFKGLNEAITELTTEKILKEHKSEIIKDVSGLRECPEFLVSEFFESRGYGLYINILNLIINLVSKNDQKIKDDFMSKLEFGMISGNMMHLREIEKSFGKNSLRVLSLLGSKNEKTDFIIFDYFKTFIDNNLDRREKLLEQILAGDLDLTFRELKNDSIEKDYSE